MSVAELLQHINEEDQKVPLAIKEILPAIEKTIALVVDRLSEGGRLFYIGAGTSGRLGIVDASECPPTFGVEQGLVIGLIAGGDRAIRYPVENAEDDINQGWLDLEAHQISSSDIVIGIAASGRTPYVVGALKKCNEKNIATACITCNPDSPITQVARFPIVAAVGPEFVSGSTRMKSGTAQKLILNMISTATMIQLGHVVGNRMVDMQLTNHKLVERGVRMIVEQTGLQSEEAKSLLLQEGNVRKALIKFKEGSNHA